MPKWKPVALDGDILGGDIDGLLGIEELCYEEDEKQTVQSKLQTGSKRKAKKPARKKESAKKQKLDNKRSSFDESNVTFLSKMQSWTGFGICNEILKALYDKGFTEPTDIQLNCLGPAMSKRDILACAETGSGKTLAFAIPMVNGILRNKLADNEIDEDESNDEQFDEEDWEEETNGVGCVKVKNFVAKKNKSKLLALVLAPTRELALQVKNHIEAICVYTSIRVALVVGGLAHEKQERLLSKSPEIVVATPGRLWELINLGNPHLQTVNSVKYLAIDETDRMLERGHFEELRQLLERINFNKQKNRRQNFVLSATLTMVHDPPSYLRGKKRKRVTPGQKLQALMDKIGIVDAKMIDMSCTKVTAQTLVENKILCQFEEKDYYLYYFLTQNKGRVIVFCNSIGCVKRLANLLSIVKLRPLPIHASMEQKQRLRNLDKFRDCSSGILLATDVAARGLDIAGVDHVVHYQVPRSTESYVHRSGRTARGGSTGAALLLVDTSEHSGYVRLIRTLGREKDIGDLDIELPDLQHVKQVIHLARDIDKLSLALKKEADTQSWYQKAAKDMDIFLDENEIPKAISSVANKRVKKDLSLKQKELQLLISAPPKIKMNGKFPDMNFAIEGRRDLLKIPGAFVLKKIPQII